MKVKRGIEGKGLQGGRGVFITVYRRRRWRRNTSFISDKGGLRRREEEGNSFFITSWRGNESGET